MMSRMSLAHETVSTLQASARSHASTSAARCARQMGADAGGVKAAPTHSAPEQPVLWSHEVTDAAHE
jgi:hypothetical protein